jgi:hypothetical protein
MCSLVMRPITSLARGLAISPKHYGPHSTALPHSPDDAEHNFLLVSDSKIATRHIAQPYPSVVRLEPVTDLDAWAAQGLGGV